DDDDQLLFYYVNQPVMPMLMPFAATRGIDLLALSSDPPASILARVTLDPPPYALSSITGLYGFRGPEWVDVSENGFTASRNKVAIVSGYTGNDWLYGVTGNDEHDAVFANNSTVHCIDPGMTPPCPGGDNTREVRMNFLNEIIFNNRSYYLYWGFATFNYDPTYAYGGGPQRMGFYIAIPREYRIDVLKLDIDTHQPIGDTEFTLLKYPVKVENGIIVADTTQIAADDSGWQEVGSLVTDPDGKVCFDRLSFGYYQIVESRPNELYMSYEESGGTPRFLKIDRYSTPELQVFEDELIKIGVEVYKNTITLTSAAFKTMPDDSLQIDNTSVEYYHYDLYFRSTSNVRVDEFTVVDPLENVTQGQVRVVEIYTPVTWGDSDGYMNIWYQTNYTDSSQSYSDANASSNNPYNPNNPTQTQVWPSTGWRLWQAQVPTNRSIVLSVSDLPLLDGEYITALRYEYGSVEVGFTNLNTSLSTNQCSKTAKPQAIDWTPQLEDCFYAEAALNATGLRPATYLVSCPVGLLPPTTISSSVKAHLARNIVLTDEDYDDVFTQVIEPFMLETKPRPVIEGVSSTNYSRPVNHLPRTGDRTGFYLAAIVIAASVLGFIMIGRSRRHQTPVSRGQ
ncbi:MAG: prealbumin-like fold domain-containing protein, partial [Coriobacteriia bacterium]|nr:prealbumin-like fold domain-containing protein [Coriobacteriia bacterium]